MQEYPQIRSDLLIYLKQAFNIEVDSVTGATIDEYISGKLHADRAVLSFLGFNTFEIYESYQIEWNLDFVLWISAPDIETVAFNGMNYIADNTFEYSTLKIQSAKYILINGQVIFEVKFYL